MVNDGSTTAYCGAVEVLHRSSCYDFGGPTPSRMLTARFTNWSDDPSHALWGRREQAPFSVFVFQPLVPVEPVLAALVGPSVLWGLVYV